MTWQTPILFVQPKLIYIGLGWDHFNDTQLNHVQWLKGM